MLESPGWEALQKLIVRGRDFGIKKLYDGPTKELAQIYREVGWLAGLDQIKEVAETFLVKAEQVRQETERLAQQVEAQQQDER